MTRQEFDKINSALAMIHLLETVIYSAEEDHFIKIVTPETGSDSYITGYTRDRFIEWVKQEKEILCKYFSNLKIEEGG